MYSEQAELLDEIAKSRKVIQDKYRELKIGRQDVQRDMGELLKPVISPLNKLIDIKNPVKKEDEPKKKENDDDEPRKKRKKFKFQPALEVPTTPKNVDDLLTEDESEHEIPANLTISDYLEMILRNDEKIDPKLGIRYTKNRKPMIGSNDVQFLENNIEIGNNKYTRTPGLLELLFMKQPDESKIRQDDVQNYRNIIRDSNAHRKYFRPNEDVRKDDSYGKKSKYLGDVVEGSGILPKYMIAKRKSHTEYTYWDDPNELVDRLRLLIAEKRAGNNNHDNEIQSILEELREAEIIY